MKAAEPTVFVVDDDAYVREALASLIGSVALRVECFASSMEFLQEHDSRAGNARSWLSSRQR